MTTLHDMTASRSVHALLLAASAWLALPLPASAAADLCRPSTTLAADRRLEIAVDAPGPAAWLVGTLAQPLELPFDAAEGRLAGKLPVPGLPIGRGKLRDDQARLQTSDASGALALRADERRFAADVVNHVVRSADGAELAVSPDLEGSPDFEIAPGATLRRLAPGRTVIEAGATLVWRAHAGKPLDVYLAAPARLLEVVAPVSAQVIRTTPALVPHGGKLEVTIDAPGIGVRDEPPVFCLQVGERRVVIPGRFSRQEGTALRFELRLDDDDVRKLLEHSDTWSRLRGVPATLRAVVYKGAQPVMDAEATLRLSSIGWSIAAGAGAVLSLTVVFALVMREARPQRIVQRLIAQDGGRLSLSNLQFLLWTLAVLFALVFTVVSTDTLLPLSTGVLGLLGIAGGSSVLARSVEQAGPDAAANPQPARSRWSELLNNPANHFDLLRLQMLAFTVFSLLYSLYSVVRSNGFPDLPDSLYWLMGVSNLSYVSGKVADVVGANRKADADKPAPASAPAPAQGGDMLPAGQLRLLQQRLGVSSSGVLDAATSAAVQRYKQDNALYPADGRVHEPLLRHLGLAAAARPATVPPPSP